MSSEGLIAAIERALFMARNGKVQAFVAIYLLDNCKAVEILEVPKNNSAVMIGFTNILLRDVMAATPLYHDADIEDIEDPA